MTKKVASAGPHFLPENIYIEAIELNPQALTGAQYVGLYEVYGKADPNAASDFERIGWVGFNQSSVATQSFAFGKFYSRVDRFARRAALYSDALNTTLDIVIWFKKIIGHKQRDDL